MDVLRNRNRHFIRGIGIVDETSCGPLCQHPACWKSNERVEKGFPNVTDSTDKQYDSEDDLPTINVYNMLEDYGFNSKDRFQGVPKRSSEPKPARPTDSLQIACCPMNSPSPSRLPVIKSVEPKVEAIPVKQVEVQEVFDLEDLSNTWENTFLAKQYYVWVPNPNWRKSHSAEGENEQRNPGPITPRDLTEDLVPRSIETAREAAVTKRHTHNRSSSPFRFFSPTFWQSSRDEVDIDGINELLDLPRDILMKVLDHCHPNDLKSRAKLREIIQRFMPHYEPINSSMDHTNDDVLRQKKIPLYDGRMKNLRQQSTIVTEQRVFQLDKERVQSAKGGLTPMNSSVEIKQPENPRNTHFSRYKQPLPGIGAAPSDNLKVSSVSLGLPELPSGVKTTRPFNYTNLNMDFTLGPSLPLSSRSLTASEMSETNHGTTVNVNIPSQRSERLEVQTLPDPFTDSHISNQETNPELGCEHSLNEAYICPDPPVGTPLSAPGIIKSLTKSSGLRREVTLDLSVHIPGESSSQSKPAQSLRKGSGKSSRERTQEKTLRIGSPAKTQREKSQTESQRSLGSNTAILGKISESGTSELSYGNRGVTSKKTIVFQKEVPPQPPSSPQSHLDHLSLSPVPTVTHVITNINGINELNAVTPQATQGESSQLMDADENDTPLVGERQVYSPVSSTDIWPTDIVEKNFDRTVSNTPQSTHTPIPMTPHTLDSTVVCFDNRSEKSVLTTAAPSEVSIQMSENSSAKQAMVEKSSRESPGPPPPSPEPKLRPQGANPDRFSSKSRDSLSMAPVYEEEESDAGESISANPPDTFVDSQHFPAEFNQHPDADGQNDLKLHLERAMSLEEQQCPLLEEESDLQVDFEPESTDIYSSPPAQYPPETDGRSSTYLTDRDLRFTPEGMESPQVQIDGLESQRSGNAEDGETPRYSTVAEENDDQISDQFGEKNSQTERRNEDHNQNSVEETQITDDEHEAFLGNVIIPDDLEQEHKNSCNGSLTGAVAIEMEEDDFDEEFPESLLLREAYDPLTPDLLSPELEINSDSHFEEIAEDETTQNISNKINPKDELPDENKATEILEDEASGPIPERPTSEEENFNEKQNEINLNSSDKEMNINNVENVKELGSEQSQMDPNTSKDYLETQHDAIGFEAKTLHSETPPGEESRESRSTSEMAEIEETEAERPSYIN